jgi:hypothetical protein
MTHTAPGPRAALRAHTRHCLTRYARPRDPRDPRP